MLMLILASALVTFLSITLLMTAYVSKDTRRKIAGQWAGRVDLTLHALVILLFVGTSTVGLIQAELAAITFTLYNRYYYRLVRGASYKGKDGKWVFVPGLIGSKS